MIIKFRFFSSKYAALTIWPFILVKDTSYKYNETLINHEKIHLKQQVELLWFPFFIWYTIEFMVKYIKYKNWDIAYRAISFEREAYAFEDDLQYLSHRKLWSFFKYL